jgi:hypothetical protein
MSEERNYTHKRVKPINSALEKTEKKLRSREIFSGEVDTNREDKTSHSLGASLSEKNETLKKPLLPEDKGEGAKLFSSLQMRKNRIREKSVKKHFKFSAGENCIKDKINKFREFLFVLNYSNRLYRNMDLELYPQPLKYFVGRGNNSNLIRSLMKKRFWFEEVGSDKEANFVWTQIKLPHLFERQAAMEVKVPSAHGDKKTILKGLMMPKTDPLAKILYLDEYREMVQLQ